MRPARPLDPLNAKKCSQSLKPGGEQQTDIEAYFSNMGDCFLSALMEGKTQVNVQYLRNCYVEIL